MMTLNKFQSYLLVFLLLFFSGNPLTPFVFGKYSTLVGLLLSIIILKSNLKFDTYFSNKLKLILFTIIIIALFQYLTLATLSFLALFNLVLKIIMGGLVINSLKDRFAYVFFRVVSGLSLISLIGFVIINLFGLNLPFIPTGLFYKSYFLYGNLPDEALLRNAGMFWEPGAYAGVLTLCLALNFKYLHYYWDIYRYQLIYIIVALITTQSTTGYLVGFFIIFFYFFKAKNLIFTFILISVVFSGVLYVYESSNFLKEKIENQFENSTEQKIGEFSNTRFGSLVFDWYYIIKHPFIGNGFDVSTRYADHQYLFKGVKGDAIGSGNAFSNFLASMGVIFVFGYLILVWKTATSLGGLFAMLFTLIIFFNLQGEQWFNFPLYLGLPFLFLSERNNKLQKSYFIQK
jgi:hypothetical protein